MEGSETCQSFDTAIKHEKCISSRRAMTKIYITLLRETYISQKLVGGRKLFDGPVKEIDCGYHIDDNDQKTVR